MQWFHVILTSYGAWLPGDPRGFPYTQAPRACRGRLQVPTPCGKVRWTAQRCEGISEKFDANVLCRRTSIDCELAVGTADRSGGTTGDHRDCSTPCTSAAETTSRQDDTLGWPWEEARYVSIQSDELPRPELGPPRKIHPDQRPQAPTERVQLHQSPRRRRSSGQTVL